MGAQNIFSIELEARVVLIRDLHVSKDTHDTADVYRDQNNDIDYGKDYKMSNSARAEEIKARGEQGELDDCSTAYEYVKIIGILFNTITVRKIIYKTFSAVN